MAYTVTARNKFFWQTLAVSAVSVGDAALKFDAYLSAPEQQADEEYEYEQQRQIVNGRLDSEDWPQPDRSDYEYCFDDDQVEEDDTIGSTPAVVMLRSGGLA